MHSILIFAAVLAAAEPAQAGPPPPAPVSPAPAPKPGIPYAPPEPPRSTANGLVTKPEWTRRPNGEDLGRYYPDRALRLEMEGRVTMQCSVTAEGALADCRILEETPRDMGFGDAALKMSRLFRMKPLTADGTPVTGATVRIPLAFLLPEDPSPPVDLVTPLTYDEAVMCHAVFSRRIIYRHKPEAAFRTAARDLAIRLGAEEGLSPRAVNRALKRAFKTGVYDTAPRCQMISGYPVP